MINITPTNYYNTNFKANPDYSQIYKEMEKITLRQEEKIIPKKGSRISQLMRKTRNILDKRVEFGFPKIQFLEDIKANLNHKEPSFYVLLSSLLLGGSALISAVVYAGNKELQRIKAKTEYIQEIANEKAIEAADSLESLSNDSTISFDECRSKMNSVINDYDYKTHLGLIKDLHFLGKLPSVGKIKHDKENNLLFHFCILNGIDIEEKTKIDCSTIHNKVELLNQKRDSLLNTKKK